MMKETIEENKLKPESKSKSKYMQSISNVAVQMINSFRLYPNFPIIYFWEWCIKFIKFHESRWIWENQRYLYLNQRFGMIPCDFCSQDLTDEKLTHKIWRTIS